MADWKLFLFWLGTTYLFWRILYATYFLRKVYCHYHLKRLINSDNQPSLFLFIPLLNESQIFEDLVSQIKKIISDPSRITVVFVTTEREYVLGGRSGQADTVQLVKDFLVINDSPRLKHIHYPEINKNVAEQLNYALHKIEGDGISLQDTYFGFLNADARISLSILRGLKEAINTHNDAEVFQVSSAFFANKNFKGIKGLILRANALRQTRWTFLYEVPRYLRSYPPTIDLQHVVTNGLYIRGDIFRSVGYFPTDSFGEDLYLGFLLHAAGYRPVSIPILDNSESPSTLKSMMRQKFVWFWGPYGYLYYWARIRKRFPKIWKRRKWIIVCTTVAGILDALNWMFAGIIYPLYIFLGFTISVLFGWFALFLVSLYLTGTLVATGLIYNIQARELKYAPMNISEVFTGTFLYPLILFLHGLPPWLTIAKDLKIRWTREVYLRPKTERI